MCALANENKRNVHQHDRVTTILKKPNTMRISAAMYARRDNGRVTPRPAREIYFSPIKTYEFRVVVGGGKLPKFNAFFFCFFLSDRVGRRLPFRHVKFFGRTREKK